MCKTGEKTMDNQNMENTVTNNETIQQSNGLTPEMEAQIQAMKEAASMETTNTYSYTSSEDYSQPSGGGINVLGLIGMILGIVGIVVLVCCCCKTGAWNSIATLIFGIPAIILSAIGMKKRPDKKGMAIAGLILGIACVVSGVIGIILAILGTILEHAVGGMDEMTLDYILNNMEDIMQELQ